MRNRNGGEEVGEEGAREEEMENEKKDYYNTHMKKAP